MLCYNVQAKDICICDCLYLDVVLGEGNNENRIGVVRLGRMSLVVSTLCLHGWVFLEVY